MHTWRWVAVRGMRSSQVAAASRWRPVSSVRRSSTCCVGLEPADWRAWLLVPRTTWPQRTDPGLCQSSRPAGTEAAALKTRTSMKPTIATIIQLLRWPRVHSGKRNVTGRRPPVRQSVCPVGIPTMTHGAASDADSVHFGLTIKRTDILVSTSVVQAEQLVRCVCVCVCHSECPDIWSKWTLTQISGKLVSTDTMSPSNDKVIGHKMKMFKPATNNVLANFKNYSNKINKQLP